MRNSSTPQNNSRQNPAAGSATSGRPEIRDNLDSRKGEEQKDKGDDATFNEKETKKDKSKKKQE